MLLVTGLGFAEFARSSLQGCLLPSRVRLLVCLCALIFLQACDTPTKKLINFADQKGLENRRISTGTFDLLVVDNNQPLRRDGVLHVYLEGDGSPWRHRVFVWADPTPRNPLMLRLMSRDRTSAVYLGRPCYNGTFSDPGCDSSLWTSGRYSSKVVRSMAAGIRALVQRKNASDVRLMGHSGGGALALLLAAEIPEVSRVVTLAGNLDIDAWTDHHGYTPLFSSRNPSFVEPLRQGVWQWHLIGLRDTVIPSQLIKPFILSQKNATGIEFSQFTHGCCWGRIWPEVLQALANDQPAAISGVQFKTRVESP